MTQARSWIYGGSSKVVIADKGYESKEAVTTVEDTGEEAVIPSGCVFQSNTQRG